jgi:hypothetical protein
MFFYFDYGQGQLGVMSEEELRQRLKIEVELEESGGESTFYYWNAFDDYADDAFVREVRLFDLRLGKQAMRIAEQFEEDPTRSIHYPPKT